MAAAALARYIKSDAIKSNLAYGLLEFFLRQLLDELHQPRVIQVAVAHAFHGRHHLTDDASDGDLAEKNQIHTSEERVDRSVRQDRW